MGPRPSRFGRGGPYPLGVMGLTSFGLGPALALALSGCVSIDAIETPNGTLDLREASRSAAQDAGAPGVCPAGGWSWVRLGGRDQRAAWAAPALTPSCGGSGGQLSAIAPGLGSSLLVVWAASTGRLAQATYSTTELGADGEQWGPYEALTELDVVWFAPEALAGARPFELSGTIWGPYGAVALDLAGCATLRPTPC